MISNDSKILLTVSRGKSLAKAGVYKEAEVSVKNSFQKNEEYKVLKQMRVVDPPEYKESTQVITLGHYFIKNALSRPEKPRQGFYHWIKTPIGKLFQDWKRMSDNQKLQIHLDELAESLGGTVKSWDLI